MENQPRSQASLSLPFEPYRFGAYVGNDVKVVFLLMGSDDGSIGKLADSWTLEDGTADLTGLLGGSYVDTVAWDFGCEERNEFSASIASLGFTDDFDVEHLDAFIKNHPEVDLTVSYESNRYNGVAGWRRGKRTDWRHTLNRWSTAETGYQDVPYEEFVKLVGEGSW